MLSTAIKTSLVFFLVVIVIHLMIRKALNERTPPPAPPSAPSAQSVPPLIPLPTNVSKPIVAPTDVQCSVQPAKTPTSDDLFNFVFKCKAKESLESTPQLAKPAEMANAEKQVDIAQVDIAGICSYDDNSTALYGEFASS